MIKIAASCQDMIKQEGQKRHQNILLEMRSFEHNLPALAFK